MRSRLASVRSHSKIHGARARCECVLIESHKPGKIGGAEPRNLYGNESAYGPNAGETEVLIPAGYVTTVYDAKFALSPDRKKYLAVDDNTPTPIPAPGLPFSLVFRAEIGKEDVILKVASAYQNASKRRVMPPSFGPLANVTQTATK